MDCCSKIDFADFRTCSKVSSVLGLNLVPNCNNFLLNFEPKSTSETDFIFWHQFSVQSLPKCVPKRSQNALSELWQTTLGPLWPHQARFLVSKTPPQSLKKLILTSYGGQLDPIFPICRLFWHHYGAILLVNHNAQSYNGAHCSQLTDRSIIAYASSSFIIQ